MPSINKILEDLNLTSSKTKELFSSSTRDIEDLNVFRDSQSGVIFIDDYYVGDKIYEGGEYRENTSESNHSTPNDPQVEIDALRRFEDFKYLCENKNILDFGCGEGRFLEKIQHSASNVIGVELQQSFLDNLSRKDITSFDSLNYVDDESIDVIFLFHVFEHLPDPVNSLFEIKKKLKTGGIIVLEVPHANDFLLSHIKSEAFKKFTLWSQHLVLHTKKSITLMLDFANFQNITVKGVQRYPLSNHIHWIHAGKPGGHLKDLAEIDSKNLQKSYQESLEKINATDTIVAIGYK